MKAVTLERFGGANELHLADLPTPTPLPNEVQIQVAYTAVNPVDWKIREGHLKQMFPYRFPIIPGWDAAGTITAVGSKVTNFKVGDEVYAYCRKPTVQWGTYAEYVCFDAENVALKPKKLSFAQAASIPLVGLTAWQALFDVAKLQPGESILIHAGAGGVGSLAIEFAKNVGATVYTTCSEKNKDYVKKLGADFVIDYNREDFAEKIRSWAPNGIDVVLDCVGGETLEKSYALLKPKGRIISIVNKVDKIKCKEHNLTGDFVLVAPNGAELKEIADLIDQKKVTSPQIEEFPLTQCALAQEKNKQGHTRGKIVLRVIS
jgi:NADPH2:quinone reductase